MRPSNTDTAACGAQLLVLPAESQPAPAAISTRDTSGWERGSACALRAPISPAPDAPASFDPISAAETEGDGTDVGDAATGDAGATGTGVGTGSGATGGLIQISARVALSRSTALTASTAARRSGEPASSGNVCTAERPGAASVTQISDRK